MERQETSFLRQECIVRRRHKSSMFRAVRLSLYPSLRNADSHKNNRT